jgi:N-acetyl-anhydromuramyl-L-alanine amidase AmpD
VRVEKIAAHEKRFFDTGDIYGVQYSLSDHEYMGLKYTKCIPSVKGKEYYYDEQIKKEKIVTHFTEGYLKGDLQALTGGRGHVSVPFLIARSGTILNLFPSGDWSYHLGPSAKGGNTTQSKLSIGIELSNIGPLLRDGDVLRTLYGDVYCDITDHWAYHKFDQAFRGYYYFATYTEEQDKSLVSLFKYLTKRYSIPATFFEPAFETSDNIINFNFRDDKKDNGNYKKVDIGPAFQWEKIKRELNNG